MSGFRTQALRICFSARASLRATRVEGGWRGGGTGLETRLDSTKYSTQLNSTGLVSSYMYVSRGFAAPATGSNTRAGSQAIAYVTHTLGRNTK